MSGPPIPVEQKERQQRLNLNVVDEMLAFVKENGLFEQTAYGIKNVGTCNGKMEQLDSVKMTAAYEKAWMQYRETFAPTCEDRADLRNDYNSEQDEGEKRVLFY